MTDINKNIDVSVISDTKGEQDSNDENDNEIDKISFVDGHNPDFEDGFLEKSRLGQLTTDESGSNFDINLYSSKKTAAQGLLDLALLMANASQLKHLLMTDEAQKFRTFMIILVSISIALQIVIGVGLLYSTQLRITNDMVGDPVARALPKSQKKLEKVDYLNNSIVVSIFILTIVNVFISAFGLSETPPSHPKP